MSNPIYNGSDKRLQQLFQNGGGGGGGTTVVANPSGEATDELEKLQVGETIYDIPTGGGGSSTLAGLTDVELTSPTDGQVLTYNNGEWVNGEGGSGGMCYLNTMYSETEQKVGYWTDGKPLYQKTVHYNNTIPANFNNFQIPCGITTVDNVVSIKVVAVDSSGLMVQLPLHIYTSHYQGPTYSVNVQQFDKTTGNLRIDTGEDVGYVGAYVTLQYTKTTDTPEVPQRGNVIYLPTIYSDEEREVGVWTDGKPLYQKSVYKLNQQSSFSDYENFAELSGVDTVVSMLYNVKRDSIWMTAVSGNRPELHNTDYFFGVRYYNGYIQYRIDTYGTQITDMYVTLQYTKTTDTAGSGSWTPSGANAVHYSTNEQIVGTWIDGKTLYEATIEVDNPTKQTFGNYYSYDANYSGHNIDYVQCIAKQCHDSHDQRWYDLPYHRIIDTESILCQGMKLDSTGQYSFAVFFRTSEQYDIDKIRYTIQYTKTS